MENLKWDQNRLTFNPRKGLPSTHWLKMDKKLTRGKIFDPFVNENIWKDIDFLASGVSVWSLENH